MTWTAGRTAAFRLAACLPCPPSARSRRVEDRLPGASYSRSPSSRSLRHGHSRSGPRVAGFRVPIPNAGLCLGGPSCHPWGPMASSSCSPSVSRRPCWSARRYRCFSSERRRARLAASRPPRTAATRAGPRTPRPVPSPASGQATARGVCPASIWSRPPARDRRGDGDRVHPRGPEHRAARSSARWRPARSASMGGGSGAASSGGGRHIDSGASTPRTSRAFAIACLAAATSASRAAAVSGSSAVRTGHSR